MKKIGLISVLLSSYLFSMTLEEGIEKVKLNNLEVKNSLYDIQMMQKDMDIIKSKFYGSIDLETNILRSNDPGNTFGFKLSSGEATFGDFGFDEFLGPLSQMIGGSQIDPNQLLNTAPNNLNNPNATNFFQTKLTYQLPIYTGGILTNYEEITKKAKEISFYDNEKIEKEKINELKKSFNNYRFIEQSIEQLSKILKIVERFEDTVKKFKELGYAKKVDVLEVQSKKYEVEKIWGNLQTNKYLLQHYISFLVNEKVKSIETFENKEERFIASKDLSNNTNIKKVSKAVEIMDTMIEVKKGDYLPMIGVFSQLSSSGTELNGMIEEPKYTIGVGLKWNIFNGFGTNIELEKEKLKRLKMKNNLNLAKKGLELKLDQIFTNIKNLVMQERQLEKQFELNQEIHKNYLGRYKEKLVSINEVLQKQTEVIKTLIELNSIKTKKSNQILEYNKIINKDK